MKNKYSFIDPGAIMGVVVALLILAVGTFAFFVTVKNIPTGNTDSYTSSNNMMNNTTGIGTQVFNIIGIVLVIGAIMAIVGLVYNYVR